MERVIVAPAPIWLWVGLVVGIAALVGAIMILFLTKPKLRVFFDSGKGYRLFCWIRNMPIANKGLLAMGLERRCQEISPVVTIKDQYGKVVSFLNYPRTSSDDVRLGIVQIKSKYDGIVFLKDALGKFGSSLSPSEYEVELELYYKGRCLLRKTKSFGVNPQYPFVEWLSDRCKFSG